MMTFCGKVIRINLFNTAFLSQRTDKQTLSLPQSLLEASILPDASADLTISLQHHSEGWLEANFKRFFRKLIETTSDHVFTGHEHLSDYHLTEALNGSNITYVEADALQDKHYPLKSGFNSLLIDFDIRKQSYFLFRWKTDHYTPVVDGKVHDLRINPKGGAAFALSERYARYLSDDDFGFRHVNKPALKLEDIFVYPSASKPAKNGKGPTIPGEDLLNHVLNEKYVLFHGDDLYGKTALLKTLFKDIFSSTSIVPVMANGNEFKSRNEDAILKTLWSHVGTQYGDSCAERFRQLPLSRRALILDDSQVLNFL